MRINVTSILVDDQARALAFYTDVLGFVKKTDIPLGGGARWLTVVSPENPDGVELVLEPDAHPAARPFKEALVADGHPLHVVRRRRRARRARAAARRGRPLRPRADDDRPRRHRDVRRHLRQPDPDREPGVAQHAVRRGRALRRRPGPDALVLARDGEWRCAAARDGRGCVSGSASPWPRWSRPWLAPAAGRVIRAGPAASSRTTSSTPSLRWPVQMAAAEWNRSGARVRLVERPAGKAPLSVRAMRGGGCIGAVGFAPLGALPPGWHDTIWLQARCGRFHLIEIAVHEFGHVLGLGHDTRHCSVMSPVRAAAARTCCTRGSTAATRSSASTCRRAVALYGGRVPRGPRARAVHVEADADAPSAPCARRRTRPARSRRRASPGATPRRARCGA